MGSASSKGSKKRPFSAQLVGFSPADRVERDDGARAGRQRRDVGLRGRSTDEEVERLFSLLGDGKIDNHQNWKGRFKDNSDKMRTGSIYDMADVLKSLTFLSKSKSLSFREKRMLDRAKALIISEISEVMREKALDIEERVDKALEKCFIDEGAQRSARGARGQGQGGQAGEGGCRRGGRRAASRTARAS